MGKNLTPSNFRDLTVDERVELAARIALETYCSVIDKDDFLKKLSKSNPKEFALFVGQMLRLQIELEKVRLSATNPKAAEQLPPNITISFVKPEDQPESK